MARTKATVRRINAPSFVAAPGQKIGNKNILNRKMQDLKLKKVCPNKNRLRERKMAKWQAAQIFKGTIFIQMLICLNNPLTSEKL